MRITTVVPFGAFAVVAFVSAATAAPITPDLRPRQASSVVQVAGGCGVGFHRHRGYCVPNRRYRPYAYYHRYRRYYGYYGPSPYYGGGYQPWNIPSPGDHVADQLNAQQLYGGYRPY